MLTSQMMEVDKRSYLFLGKPGTRKTLTLGTFIPTDYKKEDKPWAYVFAFDRKQQGGMTVLQGVPGIEYDIFVDRSPRPVSGLKAGHIKHPKPPQSIGRFIDKFNEIDDTVLDGSFSYSLVALDSATGLATSLYEEIMYKHRVANPQAKPELLARTRPALNEIGDAQWYMMDYVKAMTQLPCTFVCVAHTAYDSDSDGNRRMFPKLPGQAINDDFLSLFDEVYYFEQEAGSTEVKVRTVGTLTIPARTSQPALAPIEEPDARVWRQKMEAYYAELRNKLAAVPSTGT